MTTLKDLYIEELQDLWSANDQMEKVVSKMAEKTEDRSLAERLRQSQDGIRQHADALKGLIEEAGGAMKKEHCKGMEGLVAEAKKHALEADLKGPVLDAAILAQYQRLCHYGIAGFGTAKAYAEALGQEQAANRLDHALDRIYDADDYATELAERSKNAKAA